MFQQRLLPFESAIRYDPKAWVSFSGNAEAMRWITSWPQWPLPKFLWVYGASGHGKTYLAHIWNAISSGLMITPLNKEIFSQHPYDLLRENIYISLDDIDLCCSEREEWFFHLFNGLIEMHGSCLFTSRTPPSKTPIHLPDLRSRFNSIPCVRIERLNESDSYTFLETLFQKKGLHIEASILHYLLDRIERSPQSFASWAQRINQKTLEEKIPLTLSSLRKIISNLLD
jgi:chromosomal replication initiation ATPase DnaA